jgi:predicted metal-binding membrane protein
VESARLPRITLPSRVQLGLISALLVLATVGWAVTDERMHGMDAGPATDPGSLGFWITAWAVMMAAMMFPSIMPMVLMYVAIQRGKRGRGEAVPAGATTLFVSGYLATWTAMGLVAYGVIEAGQALDIGALGWDEAGPYVAGGVIVLAAIYQLTPLKDICLRHCRSPFMFLVQHWRPGRTGAFRMGVTHGAYCVGCCWALMAALIALGVMSVGWMVFIAALIAIEKLLPWKAVANRGIALLLLVLGLGVAFTPEDVPGLTLPDSPQAMRAMDRMGMKGDEGGGSMGGMEKQGGMDKQGSGSHRGSDGGAGMGSEMESHR